MPAQRLTDVTGAAQYLGMTENALRKAERRGIIPSVRPPGERRLLFDLRALDRWIERHTSKAS